MSPNTPPDLIAHRHALILQCIGELARGLVILRAELDTPPAIDQAKATTAECLTLVVTLDMLAGGVTDGT